MNYQQFLAVFCLFGALTGYAAAPDEADALMNGSDAQAEKHKQTPRFLSGDKGEQREQREQGSRGAGEQGSRDRKTSRPEIFSSATLASPATPATLAPLPAAVKVAQSAGSSVKVTAVQLNKTDSGLVVILKTLSGATPTAFETTYNETYVADLISSKLQLPDGKEFRVDHPAPGIASVSVTQLYENTVRVKVVGDGALPTGRVVTQSGGISVSLTPGVPTAQKPAPTPAVTPSPGTTQPSPTPSESPTLTPPAGNQPPAIAPGTGQKPSSPSNSQELPPITVIGKPESPYNPTNATTGTRTNTPLRDIPQTVNVIPQQVIKDERILYIGDALKNVGVAADRYPGSQDRFVIRGFNSSFGNILIDGLRNNFLAGANPINLNNIERIEVLRGPASVLYGRAGLGGIVNLITKQPLKEPYYAADFSVGNYNAYRGSIDFSGPLTTNKNVSYRLNASYLNSDSFIDFYNEERYQIAGALSWDIDKNTKLTLNASYGDYNTSLQDEGLPAIGTLYPNPKGKIPISRYVGEVGTIDTITTRLSYKLEHRFSDKWSLENAFGAIDIKGIANPTGRGVPISLLSNDETLTRRRFVQPGYLFQNGYDLNTLVTGRFKTGSLEHQLVIGTEYAWTVIFGANQNFTAPSINIFNPAYGLAGGGTLLNQSKNRTNADNLGVYAQDLIALSQNLKLVLGGRYDWVGQTNDNLLASTSTSFSSEAFSPRVGIVYQPIKPLSLYASYARSFIPQPGLSATGQSFQPQRGTQYEVGAKTDLIGEKLSVNLALYDLTQSNILTADPNNPSFSIPVGEANSKGVELFVTGEISPGWNVIASYAYADPRVTKDNTIPIGKQLPLAAQNIASLWTTYIIPHGNLKGLGAGFGLFYVGDRFVDSAEAVKLPSYVRTDAALFYRRGQFNAALNFQNLFNIHYFEGGFGSTRSNTVVYYGYPSTVTFTLGWKF